MKLKLLLLLITTNTLFVFGQDFEKTFQENPLMAGQIVQTLNNSDFLIGTVDNFSAAIYRMDSQGNIVWKASSLQSWGDPFVFEDILVTNENEAYAVLTQYSCDVGGLSTTIVKLDLNTGTVLCMTEFNSDEQLEVLGSNVTGFKNLMRVDDSNVLLISTVGNFHITESCQLIESEGYLQAFSDVLNVADNNFLAVGTSSYGLLTYPDIENASIINSTNQYLKAAQATDGNFFLLHTEGLDKIDASLNLLETTLLTDFDLIIDFVVNEENIFLIGRIGTSTIIATYDYNLNWISNFIVGDDHIFPVDLSFNDNQLLLTGSIHGFGSNSSTLWVKSVSVDNLNNPPRPDVGIIDLSYDGLVYENYSCDRRKDVTIENVVVTIKNFGAIDVTSLNLSSSFFRCDICNNDDDPFTMKLENVNLLASEESEIILGDLFANLIETTNGNFEFCLWTTIPDNKIDANRTNNRHCSTTDNIVLPTTEFQNNINWNTYPNPVNKEMFIEYNLEKGKEVSFKLYNLLGKEVYASSPTFQTAGSHQEVISISTIGLENGIYILQGTFGEEMVSDKVQVIK